MIFRRFYLFALGLILASCNLPATTHPVPTLAATETALAASETSELPTFPVTPASPTATLPPGPSTFTEDFETASPYWSFMQIDNGQPQVSPAVQGGFLVFDLQAQNQWSYALYDGSDYQDVRVDAHTLIRAGEDGAIGLVCRYSKDGWYEFNVYADQTYVLLYGQWLAEDVALYTPMYRSTSEKIHTDANDLGLVCQGNSLTPFINGVQMRIWQDNKYKLTNGTIGLAVASFTSVPYSAAFDWVKVSQP